MDPNLRDAWTRIVTADDLDDHMQALGQARAKVALVKAMLAAGPAPTRRSLVFAGAGTGQMFDYVDPEFLGAGITAFRGMKSLQPPAAELHRRPPGGSGAFDRAPAPR